jgi:hypothetical protein
MRKVQIYVDNQVIDLFNDESIKVKSSTQNISDISKVFTDFSQGFNVPATDKNNSIFGFYYNNELNEFNANVRVDCRIEIDLVPFRKGKLQLEGSTIKNGQVDSYKVGFFGDVVSLKDKFSDNKLSDLDYTNLSFEATGANIQSSITSSTYQEVRYPLISSTNIWTYDDAGANDISLIGNPVDYGGLFPAVSDSKILSLIADTYNVTFEGNFLTDDRLKNSYTWWKNKEYPQYITKAIDIIFNPGATSCTVALPNAMGNSQINFDYIDTNSLPIPPGLISWGQLNHRIEIDYTPVSAGTYYLDSYKNGSLISTNTITSASSFVVASTVNWPGLSDVYTFKARSSSGGTFNFTIEYKLSGTYSSTTGLQIFSESCSRTTNGIITNSDLDFANSAPNIKISDWFTGTLNQFNLTCIPTDSDLTYQIEPLQNWYKYGQRVDITEFVNTDSIKVDRVKLYNEISFDWQKSKSFLNTEYAGNNAREYGTLKEVFSNNDGGKYAIKLPFENMLFSGFDTGVGILNLGYCLDDADDTKRYIPKPVKLFLNEITNTDFYFNDGTSTSNITQYMPFGQSQIHNGDVYSMNFGSEFDSLTNNNVQNSLYKTYYEEYLVNLFNPRTRKVSLKCVLPLDVLTKLTLDDAIIVRDKKYIINDMTTDLTSGNVDLVLISDFSEGTNEFSTVFNVDADTHVLTVDANVSLGGTLVFSSTFEAQFIVTFPLTLPATVAASGTLSISVPVNTGAPRQQNFTITSYASDNTIIWINTVTIIQAGVISFLQQENLDYILQENTDKIIL